MRSSQEIAEQVTFQSFANCYLREIDPGTLAQHAAETGEPVACVEWALSSQRTLLRAELLTPSLCGPCRFGRIWQRRLSELAWDRVEPFSVVTLLAGECYRRVGMRSPTQRGSELELLLRVLQSYQSVHRYLDAHDGTVPEPETFIAAEQSLVFGHWLHPTPKSLQGMTDWQATQYAPELHGQFRLHLFAIDGKRVAHASAASASAPAILADVFGEAAVRLGIRPGEHIVPLHPLQAEAMLLDPAIQALQAQGLLRSLGAGGPLFTATSSVRTVYSAESPWMLKFSLPVRITNSVRVNRRHELEAGVTMAKLIGAIGPQLPPSLRFILDPAYITLTLPGRAESGFEVILRENPFTAGGGAGVMTVAALTADPLPGQISPLHALVNRLVQTADQSPAAAARAWFSAYLACALVPLIQLYDTHGIALEAHQQNSLLDVSAGLPTGFYYRDSQGYYLSDRYRAYLRRYIPESDNIHALYYDEEEINRRFSYYLIVNQIFSVIARLDKDGMIAEALLLADLRSCLEALLPGLSGAGHGFVTDLLARPTLGAKFNLTTRLFNIDELNVADEGALYAHFPNPLAPQTGVAVAHYAVPS